MSCNSCYTFVVQDTPEMMCARMLVTKGTRNKWKKVTKEKENK